MGCSLAASLVDHIKRLKRRHDPDLLFIEPSEMVVTAELRDVAAMGRRDAAYDIGPLITLVDGSRFESIWQERRPLVRGQLTGADIVAVTHADRVDTPGLAAIDNRLKTLCNAWVHLDLTAAMGMEPLSRALAPYTIV